MRVLVTGAGGFLGLGITRALCRRGEEVCTLQRGDYPALRALGVAVTRGDIADRDTVFAASRGCEAVFHVAAKAGIWGDFQDYYRSNVTGTLNVLTACRQNNIPFLVYTSSPSIVFDGRDEEGIDESTPLPEHYLTHYQRTKAEAEAAVLAASGERLRTLALRPHLVFGPGDRHIAPRIIRRAQQGRLRLVGGSRKLVDVTYIDNAVSAHLLALDALRADTGCAGRAYFISNDEPMPMAEIINRILAAAGLPPVRKSVSARSAYLLGAVMEMLYSLPGVKAEPPMTRFVARQLACAHWYDINAAKRDLAYEAGISIDKGMQTLRHSLAGVNGLD